MKWALLFMAVWIAAGAALHIYHGTSPWQAIEDHQNRLIQKCKDMKGAVRYDSYMNFEKCEVNYGH